MIGWHRYIMNFKEYIEQNNISPDRALTFVVGQGGDILPQEIGMQGYFGELTDTGILFSNDKLNIEKKKYLFPHLQEPNSDSEAVNSGFNARSTVRILSFACPVPGTSQRRDSTCLISWMHSSASHFATIPIIRSIWERFFGFMQLFMPDEQSSIILSEYQTFEDACRIYGEDELRELITETENDIRNYVRA